MMSADAMDNSGMLFDSDSFDDGFVDNFSISLDNFYAILDEEPRPSQGNFSGTPEGFHPGELAPGHVDLEKAFQPQADISELTTVLEDFRGGGHSQWNLEASDCKREIGFGFLLESEGNSNNFSDNGSLHASQHSDSKNFCSLPSQHSSNWLRLSCANNNNLMDAFGGSSGSFLTSNFDHQHLQNNILQCSVPPESAKGMDLIYLPDADVNGFYFNKENGKDCEQVEGETSFKSEHKESKPDVNNISSLCRPQNGGIGSSHIMSLKNSDFCDGMHSNLNAGALPASIVEDGNLYPSLSMYSYMDPDATLPDIVHPVVNACEATNIMCDGSNSCLTLPRYSSSDAEIGLDQIFSGHFRSFLSCENEKMDRMEDQLLLSQNFCRTSEVKLGTQEESPDSSLPEVSVTDLDASLRDILCTEQNHSEDLSLISESSTDSSPIPSSRNSTSDYVDISVVSTSKQLASDPKIILPSKKPKAFLKDERKDQFFASCHNQHDAPKGGSSAVQNNPLRSSLSMEDDSDICILDDISDPACPPRPLVRIKPHPISQRSGLTDPHYSGSGGMRLKADDERLTFRIALQDLSQPKSESSPPNGVLAVPLLRHQRIALSWMVQKETASIHCSGGILADDQGLGKTISTIALILMERSPSSRSCPVIEKHDEFEALNLDDDDDASEVSVMKQPHNSIPMVMSMPMKRENSVMVAKGRPAAGTLVVCPTSVLRQWAEELQTKVTSKANLSFLVYHGSNRTKDPNELAKYDVVLTTYAIVSMEVPKQPLDDKDVEEKGKQDASGVPMGLLSNKKRKDPPISNMNKRKDRSTVDGVLLESAARPLARVGWFRVILDEAQSIKNHRTQVARACWGLRAKRRWCLSGTPIQNAVDDLYSYFRFLRYEPYAVYKSFCSTIKMPISKNPNTGYKKLQAVLKTIMLRRTKGTLIDGKPIITLPPKTVSLKRVEFSMEERAFYSTLEAESREQFKVYAAAGTLKQNYVNILLMLLRLRQACDHPLLVKGCNSNSSWRSSMEMAKKLPRDKQINLLSCLEASLAICTICNDPPEDAVVTICGHVFCNQCICELLTGDENICPSPDCKIQLSVASVFSRGTLKSSLSDELGHDCCSGSSGFEMGDTRKICEDSLSSDSSKIKAALEILQSLPRSQCSSKSNIEKSNGESTGSLVNAVNTVSLRSSVDSSGIQINLNKCSNSKVSEKAIVFSQWTRMLDLLEVPLKASFIQYRRLDGTMSVAAREKAVKDFNTLPEVTVMIMSLKAASLGLNMVAACHVLLLDLWWNPTTEDQAIDRAHRIGQTRPVTVSRLTIKDTVEDRILLLQEKKREMVASAFGEDESGTRQTRLTVEDLKYLFMV